MITVQINCKITENIWNVDVEKYIFPQNFHLTEDDDDLGKVKQSPTVKRTRSMTKCQINCQQAISN